MNYSSISSEPLRSTHPSRNTNHRLTKNSTLKTHQLSFLQQHTEILPINLLQFATQHFPTTPEQIAYYSHILKEENIFPQFSCDLQVLNFLVPNLKTKTLASSQSLWFLGSSDQNLYRIIRGEVNVRRRGDTVWKTKAKGDFVQSLEEFRITKENQAVCKEECVLLQISKEDYSKSLELSLRRKKVLQMMSKTSLFSAFKRKELSYLLGESQEMEVIGKEFLFQEGESPCQKCYFVIEGELVILKQSSEKTQIVCYVADGNFVGEEILYGFDSRTYSAAVHSNKAKIMIISSHQIDDTIDHFKLNRESVLKPSYQGYLEMRDMHYREKVQEFKTIKESFHQSKKEVKMTQTKHHKILWLLRDIQNSSEKLDRKEKLIEKRLHKKQDLSDQYLISVEHPLFVREEFPGLKKFVKRCNIFETRARQNYKLPTLL